MTVCLFIWFFLFPRIAMTTTYMTCDLWFGKKHLVIAQAKCWHVTFIIGYTFLNMYLEMLGYKSAILSLLCIRCQLFIRRRRWQRNMGQLRNGGSLSRQFSSRSNKSWRSNVVWKRVTKSASSQKRRNVCKTKRTRRLAWGLSIIEANKVMFATRSYLKRAFVRHCLALCGYNSCR